MTIIGEPQLSDVDTAEYDSYLQSIGKIVANSEQTSEILRSILVQLFTFYGLQNSELVKMTLIYVSNERLPTLIESILTQINLPKERQKLCRTLLKRIKEYNTFRNSVVHRVPLITEEGGVDSYKHASTPAEGYKKHPHIERNKIDRIANQFLVATFLFQKAIDKGTNFESLRSDYPAFFVEIEL